MVQNLNADGFWYDEESAERAVRFFPRFLRHIKGELAGDPLELADWQADKIVRPLFGWKDERGFRRYRTVFVFIPRKNGKSTLGAGLAVILTFADGEKGAEVYSCAADRNQAAIVFSVAEAMVEDSRALRKRSKVYRGKRIVVPSTRSFYQVLSADAKTKHGFNVHGLIADELHAIPGAFEGSIVEVLTTAQGSRRQPVVVYLTTAGFDQRSIAYREYKYACQVRDGVIHDPRYLPVVYEAPKDADVQDESGWQVANPNLGVSVYRDYLREKAKRAVESPVDENTFKRLHLNVWTEQFSRWIPLSKWDAGARDPVDLNDLVGRPCCGGLDLSSSEDISALVLAFDLPDGRVGIFPWFWVPEETAQLRQMRERVPYLSWIADGFVTATAGNVVDYEFLRRDINQLAERFDIREIAFDPWNALQLAGQLEGDGIPMTQHRQGFASMAAPTAAFQRLWKGETLAHGGNPVLRYQAANVAVQQDPAGNLKPAKDKSGDKIDGIVAGIMACGRLLLGDQIAIDNADEVFRIL